MKGIAPKNFNRELQEKAWEANRGRVPWNKGKVMSDKLRKKLSLAHIGKAPFNKSKKGWTNSGSFRKGRIVPQEIIKKVSDSLRGRFKGKNSPSWKGGISKDYMRYVRDRRNRKLAAEGSHTQGDWELLKKQYGYRCVGCKKFEPEIKLTEDHIIPLSKGGSDFIENIQPLCRPCNSKKYNKIISYENKF